MDCPVDLSRYEICNKAQVTAQAPLTIALDPRPWSYTLFWPIDRTAFTDGGGQLTLVIRARGGDAQVAECNAQGTEFVGRAELVKGDGVWRNIRLQIQDSHQLTKLVLRNATGSAEAPSVEIARVSWQPLSQKTVGHIWERKAEETSGITISPRPWQAKGRAPIRQLICVSHTSRTWDWNRCQQSYLRERYARPERLENLPPFESLAACEGHFTYYGGASIFCLEISENTITLHPRRLFDSEFKLEHMAMVGGRLVLCFQTFLYVLDDLNQPVDGLDILNGPGHISDPWFGGLQTVFAAGDDLCIVAASGADAVMWVDIAAKKVVRRWRLPAERYGTNYALTADMSVRDHYIFNDIQLGHLNCASPSGDGSCVVSVLGQGDIGIVDSDGGYHLLASGHVGCHGARRSADGAHFYFSDSCGGRLMAIEGSTVKPVAETDSRWLHDAVEVGPDLHLMALGDLNRLVLHDTRNGGVIAEWPMGELGENVQFLALLGEEH
jgi:hypothetical protein